MLFRLVLGDPKAKAAHIQAADGGQHRIAADNHIALGLPPG